MKESISRKGREFIDYKQYSIRLKGDEKHSCSTKLIIEFIMLINVKMPTIVGILTFISMVNTTSQSLRARNVFFQQFSFHEQ